MMRGHAPYPSEARKANKQGGTGFSTALLPQKHASSPLKGACS